MKKTLLLVLLILFSGCATTQVADKTDESEKENDKIKVVELRQSLYVTPKSAEFRDNDNKKQEDIETIFAMANKFFDLKRFEEAEKHYKTILEKNPQHHSSAYCNYNLGLINMRIMRWDQAGNYFLTAYKTFMKEEDKKDAVLNYFESLKKGEKWSLLLNETENLINNNSYNLNLEESVKQEVSLRYAESLIMTGKIEEGRKLAEFWILEITKKYARYEAVFIPELSLAYYVAGRSFVYEFNNIKLDDSVEKLEEKCRKIIEAQSRFLKAINVGVIFWTNASAFEVAKLYTDLYTEMESHPVPQDLNDEEKVVYKCELWKKISNLLTKSRKTLVKSMEAAKKINEENEYTEMSFKLISEIDDIYQTKESECVKFQ